MRYWYEKENGSLLQFEKECYFKFMRDYNNSQLKLQFSYDKCKRFCVDISLPFKVSPDMPWRTFKFHIVYEHNHPGRGSDGYFGGSIKIYPMTRLKPGFHHLVRDSTGSCPYICQVKTTNSEEVNGYKAMTRVLRWIQVYCIWEKTGVDIDK